ncbi:MAG: efflux RND transporter periplasmic adaptor subunit [Bryobacteraceae bacterium]
MSAVGTPSPTPAGEPLPVAPQSASPPKKPIPWAAWAVVAGVVLVAAYVFSFVREANKPQAKAAAVIRTATISTGVVKREVRLTGQTTARNFASITVPIMRGPDSGRELILVELAPAGSQVKKGQLIAQLDTQAAKDHVDDVQSTVSQAATDVKKRLAEQAIDWETLQQSLRTAKAEWEQAKLDYSAAEVRTVIDRELLRLDVAEAEARYKELQSELENTRREQRAEIRVLEITKERHEAHRDRHAGDMKRLTFIAPMGGLVVMQTFYRGGEMSQIQKGDQVGPGQTFMKIVDTSTMQVETEVNQSEANLLRVGQKTTITLDAFPGVEFPGHVYSIGAMGVQGWRENYYIRNVPVRVALDRFDARVIPDLSAAATIAVERQDNALLSPLEAVHVEEGKHIVYVRKGDRFEKREVRLGLRSNTHIAVLGGLNAGEVVALDVPAPVVSAAN